MRGRESEYDQIYNTQCTVFGKDFLKIRVQENNVKIEISEDGVISNKILQIFIFSENDRELFTLNFHVVCFHC